MSQRPRLSTLMRCSSTVSELMPCGRASFQRRPLATERTLFEVAAAVAADERPVVLTGAWAGGGAIIASQPLTRLPARRSMATRLADVTAADELSPSAIASFRLKTRTPTSFETFVQDVFVPTYRGKAATA